MAKNYNDRMDRGLIYFASLRFMLTRKIRELFADFLLFVCGEGLTS